MRTVLHPTEGPLLRHLAAYAEDCRAELVELRRAVRLFLYLAPAETPHVDRLAAALGEPTAAELESIHPQRVPGSVTPASERQTVPVRFPAAADEHERL